MRKSSKLLVATAAAALVATGGSAFTATSTVDNQKHVGAVTQAISGVTVQSVQYEITAGTDTTTSVTFHVVEELTADDTIAAKVTSGTGTTDVNGATTFSSSTNADCTLGTSVAGTDVTCAFSPGVDNVTKLEITAS